MKKFQSIFMGDRVIWVVFFFLCAISLVEVFSAASSLAYRTGDIWQPITRHAGFLLLGVVVAVILHRIPCRMFKVMPVLLVPASALLLVLAMLVGEEVNGSRRWVAGFQPSEFAKLAVISGVALILSRFQREEGADPKAFKLILYLTVPFCLLILTENLSTAMLLFGVVVLMMFIGRVSLLQLGKLIGVCLLGLSFVVGIAITLPKETIAELPGMHRFVTWSNRVDSHADEASDDPALFDIDKNAQVAHANIAIASSNGVGKMPGNSVERDFLSQAFSDFIFAIIIEEMGIWGATLVVILYVFLLFRTGRICSRCERNFPPFLAMGLTLMLVSQAALNMMVAVGLFPVTGQPLPLISRGGTSTIISCCYIGIILSVSRYSRQVSEPQHTRFDGPMDGIAREDNAHA